MSQAIQANKALIWDLWQKLNHFQIADLPKLIHSSFHEYVDWNGPAPVNKLRGRSDLLSKFWLPLRRAFPDLKREPAVFMAGESAGVNWVSGTGYFTGTFDANWLGIPATGRKTFIRFGQFYVLREERIAESYLILDLIDLMRQAGFQVLAPARGMEGGRIPGPSYNSGILLTEQDPLESAKSADIVLAMRLGMRRYVRGRDGTDLRSMEQSQYWHPEMEWYGPTGIGSSYSLEEYEDYHQRPWLEGFGDRSLVWTGPGRRMGNYAEGNYVCGGIWDTGYSRHNGTYGGAPGTGQTMILRDFDWWRREGDLICQNWVPIDLIHLYKQLGIDLFERMRQLRDEKSTVI